MERISNKTRALILYKNDIKQIMYLRLEDLENGR